MRAKISLVAAMALIAATPAFGQVFSDAPGTVISTVGTPSVSTDMVVGAGPVAIADVNVCIDISHTWDSDLSISVISPLGTSVLLSSGNGGSADNYTATLFDDAAATSVIGGSALAPFTGSFIPEAALAGFNGEDANGTWTLSVSDSANGDGGTINYWSLAFDGASDPACVPPAPPPAFGGDFTGTPNSLVDGVKLLGTTIWDQNNPQAGLTDGWGELANGTRSVAAGFDNLGNEVGYVINHPGGHMDITLSGLSSDLDLHLLDSTGTALGGLDASENGSTTSEQILAFLPAGTYYAVVDTFGAANAGSDYSILYVPEPGTMALLALGGLGLIRRRRNA